MYKCRRRVRLLDISAPISQSWQFKYSYSPCCVAYIHLFSYVSIPTLIHKISTSTGCPKYPRSVIQTLSAWTSHALNKLSHLPNPKHSEAIVRLSTKLIQDHLNLALDFSKVLGSVTFVQSRPAATPARRRNTSGSACTAVEKLIRDRIWIVATSLQHVRVYPRKRLSSSSR